MSAIYADLVGMLLEEERPLVHRAVPTWNIDDLIVKAGEF
jgi:hypothetical protein